MRGSVFVPAARRRCWALLDKIVPLVFISLIAPLFLRGRVAYVLYQDERPALDPAPEDGLTRGVGAVADRNSSEEMPPDSISPPVDLYVDIAITVPNKAITIPNSTKDPVVVAGSLSETRAFQASQAGRKGARSHSSAKIGHPGRNFDYSADESGETCQHEFGSYCLWSVEHKADINDPLIGKLKDQLFVARAYYPSILKVKSQVKLSHAMRQQILDHERILSEVSTDAYLPSHVAKIIEKMERTITRARSVHVDCTNVDKKLRQILDQTEDEAHFHKMQSAFLYHLGVQTMPKSLHCLVLKLTAEYFSNTSVDAKNSQWMELDASSFQHYVIFSRNVLASSVTINSTVMNSKVSGNLIFYVVTDSLNYFAMKFWYSSNSYKDSVVHVINLQEFDMNDSYNVTLEQHPSFSEEFRISVQTSDQPLSAEFTEYISIFGHAHFLLPNIFKQVRKVVVLDDDVVVQRDLSFLWNLDLDGKVNGAMHSCRVRLSHLKNYLGGSDYNKELCMWLSGINVIDLEKWREHNVTGKFEMFLHMLRSKSNFSWRFAVLPANFLAFQDLAYTLDESWVLSDLGTKYHFTPEAIQEAAVLHYNGNMKPWLDLGIQKYNKYWTKFLARGNLLMDQCNINL